MLAARAGYTKRMHSTGAMEVNAAGRGAEALCAWIAELLTTRDHP
jgi:hypothetical protein